jgi:hypothetical protein
VKPTLSKSIVEDVSGLSCGGRTLDGNCVTTSAMASPTIWRAL